MALEGPARETLANLARQMREQKPAEALAEIERALRVGDCVKAQRLCAALRKKSARPTIELCLLAADAALGVGDTTQATEETHKALQLDPQNARALKTLGDLTFATGVEPVALVYYEQALEKAESHSLLSNVINSSQVKTLKRRYLANQQAEQTQSPINQSQELLESTPELETEKKSSAVDLPSIEIASDQTSSPTSKTLTFARPAESVPKAASAEVSEKEATPQSGENKKQFTRYDRLKLNPIFETETMAQMLISQGHKQSALELLEKLAERGFSESANATLKSLRESLSNSSD
jgi:tetratricopeptide (TPR) repeat protein